MNLQAAKIWGLYSQMHWHSDNIMKWSQLRPINPLVSYAGLLRILKALKPENLTCSSKITLLWKKGHRVTWECSRLIYFIWLLFLLQYKVNRDWHTTINVNLWNRWHFILYKIPQTTIWQIQYPKSCWLYYCYY